MGIIIKQSIKGAIWSYLGVGVGFVTTAYLYPNYLTPEIVGLFALLTAWSGLFAQFSALGFHGITARLFPRFRNKENGHNGFLFIAFLFMLTGFVLFLVAFLFLRPWLVESNLEKSTMFADYIDLLVPLTFLALLFSVLDGFNKMLYDAVLGAFLTEFVQRVSILLILFLYIIGWLTPHGLILSYAGAIGLKGAFFFFFLLFRKELNFRPQLRFVDKNLTREMLSVAVYSILTGIGGSIVFQIDKIVINQVMGLNATGVYTIAFFFGTLVIIPSRTLLKISSTVIAEAWKRDDINAINENYHKSCLNQFIIAAFLFGGIWINIDNILIILGPQYYSGKWVIFFIGLGFLIDMATGTNGIVIILSKYYKVSLLFLLVMLTTVFLSMYLLIPMWGITGAAIAIAIAFLVNNFMRWLFLKVKFKMQPFSFVFIKVLLVFFVAYLISMLIPSLSLIMDIFVRSSVFTIIFGLLSYFLNVSKEINNILHVILNRINFKN
ncbi:oligosaccharide flippase family protein [uncultured Draconibacterium sp.]|uniref:lipopolysaccharide biosynthesis protein n=1 Tax=uncultured Draconibacterium sp. TaxID=1573823 RepID=UPI0029C87C28|nr:oligosaccharide flippase family protein [uncultured Draconibacterium sp.]